MRQVCDVVLSQIFSEILTEFIAFFAGGVGLEEGADFGFMFGQSNQILSKVNGIIIRQKIVTN